MHDAFVDIWERRKAGLICQPKYRMLCKMSLVLYILGYFVKGSIYLRSKSVAPSGQVVEKPIKLTQEKVKF